MEEKMFYLVDTERGAFWKNNSNGYTFNLAEAQLYTEKEALQHVDMDYCKQTVHFSEEVVLNSLKREILG